MKNEIEKLTAMLKEKKISENEYNLLFDALSKKTLCENIEESMWLNPFRKIAGYKALLFGLLIFAGISVLGIYAQVYLDGLLSATLAIGIKTKVQPNFFLLMYQLIVDCFVLGTCYFLSALLCGQKRMRLIDFYGTVAFARYPYLILVACYALLRITYPEYFQVDFSKGYDLRPTFVGSFLTLTGMSCYVWQIFTYFFAFKESSGLAGKRLWISFALSTFIFGEIIAMTLSRIPLYL